MPSKVGPGNDKQRGAEEEEHGVMGILQIKRAREAERREPEDKRAQMRRQTTARNSCILCPHTHSPAVLNAGVQ